MAKASDCGSEDRGFESHYPPHIIKAPPSGVLLLYPGEWDSKRATAPWGGEKVSGGHFFSSGESPIIHPISKNPVAQAAGFSFLIFPPRARPGPIPRAGERVPFPLSARQQSQAFQSMMIFFTQPHSFSLLSPAIRITSSWVCFSFAIPVAMLVMQAIPSTPIPR